MPARVNSSQRSRLGLSTGLSEGTGSGRRRPYRLQGLQCAAWCPAPAPRPENPLLGWRPLPYCNGAGAAPADVPAMPLVLRACPLADTDRPYPHAMTHCAVLHTSALTSLPLLARGKVRDNYAVGQDRILMVASDREAPQMRGRSMLVQRLAPIPIEAVVRGYLAGSGWKEYQATQSICGLPLPARPPCAPPRPAGVATPAGRPEPIYTPATKALAGEHDENISFARTVALIGPDLATRIRDLSIAIYQTAAAIALAKGLIIADSKFEFGLAPDGRLVLMDEVLTPDSSRYWPVAGYAAALAAGRNPPSYDKQFVRDWLEQAQVGGRPWDKTPPAPRLPQAVIESTAAKYREALERLTARELVGVD